MAKALNKGRLIIGKLMLIAAVILAFITESLWPDHGMIHEFNDAIGLLLVFTCIIGRLYCTLYIGGRKNEELVTAGPYSVTRNPLYVFSFIGVLGIGLYSNHLIILLLLLTAFIWGYGMVVMREEEFLKEAFGDAYAAYAERVPRFVPRLSLYRPAAQLEVNMRFVNNAIKDAVWWLAPLIVFELIEYFHAIGAIKPIGTLL